MTKPETIAAKAADAIDERTGAVVPAIQLATTYARDERYGMRAGLLYTRDDNPTPRHAEGVVAALEGAADARVFASGMATVAAMVRAVVRPGDRVVASARCYFGVRDWLARFGARWGVDVAFVDTTDAAAIARACDGARLLWIETPANPTWEVADIAACADLAHRAGALLAVDATALTPVHCRPLALGADLVMHSATKFLNGHSDVLAGVVAYAGARAEAVWPDICRIRHDEGACVGPLEAYLLLRGLRTLFARVERSSATALALARRLEAVDPARVTVRYPGLPSHPQHAIAARQMERGFGSMLSIQTGGGAARALAVVSRLRVWVPATSLGGVESLVEHRASVEGPDTPTPPDLLRLSVGLEHEDDLYEDLAAALS
jgi:cystathionine gamma-synthase